MFSRMFFPMQRTQIIIKAAKALTSATPTILTMADTPVKIAKKAMSMIGPSNLLDKDVCHKYLGLDQKHSVIATYIWIDGTGEGVRGKSRTLETEPKCVSELPNWSFDGSSTGQAVGENSDTFIFPVAMYPDPFIAGKNKIVLCDK